MLNRKPSSQAMNNMHLQPPSSSHASTSSLSSSLAASSSSSSSTLNPPSSSFRNSINSAASLNNPITRRAYSHSVGHSALLNSTPPLVIPDSSSELKRRPRSSSLVTVQHVGLDDADAVLDQNVVGNANAEWVNYKGAWAMHILLILLGKSIIDTLPAMSHDLSWTLVNVGYATITFLMFHWYTGVPFEAGSAGAYDELTMWEQIDGGEQNTPARKWLTLVPIVLFLISTHYTTFTSWLFALNLLVVAFSVGLKLPFSHRMRVKFGQIEMESTSDTPLQSRPPSPMPGSMGRFRAEKFR